MTSPTRIVVVDDHHLFRAGVIELLESVADFHVIADGASGTDAITLTRETKPDILILDVEMPGPGAIATIHKAVEASPGTKVVVLTMHDDPELVRSLFEAGAAGYLLKSAGRTELVAAITTASRDEGSILLAVSRATLIGLGRSATHTKSGVLSPREAEILSLVAGASSNRDIAQLLFISEGTVKRHLANIYLTLDASSRLDAVRKAIALGIIPNTFVNDSVS